MNSIYDAGYNDALMKLGFSQEKTAAKIPSWILKFFGRSTKPSSKSYVESVANSIKNRAAGTTGAAAPSRPIREGAVLGKGTGNYAAKSPAERSAEVLGKEPAEAAKSGLLGKSLKWGLPVAGIGGGAYLMTRKPKQETPGHYFSEPNYPGDVPVYQDPYYR